MSVTVTDNTASFEADATQKASLFLRIIAEAIVNLSTKGTPMKTGRLRMDVVKQVLGTSGKIVWGKNYAIFQEEKQFKNYTTPGTGPHFAENAVNEVIKDTVISAKQAGLA